MLEYFEYWDLLPIVYYITVLLFSPLILYLIQNIFKNTIIEIRYQVITDFWIQSIFYTFLFLVYNIMLISELELISTDFTLILRISVLLIALITYLLMLGGKYFKSKKIFVSTILIINVVAILGIYTLFSNLYPEYYSDYLDSFNHEPSELISQIQSGVIILVLQIIMISIFIVLPLYMIIKLFENVKESGKYITQTEKMKQWVTKYPLIKHLVSIPLILILSLIQIYYYSVYHITLWILD